MKYLGYIVWCDDILKKLIILVYFKNAKFHSLGVGEGQNFTVNNLWQIIVLRVKKKKEYHLHDTTITTKWCNYFSKNWKVWKANYFFSEHTWELTPPSHTPKLSKSSHLCSVNMLGNKLTLDEPPWGPFFVPTYVHWPYLGIYPTGLKRTDCRRLLYRFPCR